MISPNEIRKKAEKKYNEYLQSVAKDIPFTQMVITGNKKPSDNFSEFQQELTELINNSKEKKGYGYTVKYKTIRKKNLGTQDMPTEIVFETETDYLKYLHKEKEVNRFRDDCSLILTQYPELREWIIKYPQRIIDRQDKWRELLKVCNYFKCTPCPSLYIRELPIQVHTKFIENNKFIIRELLDVLIAEHINQEEKEFEKRFNLKYSEPLIRFRILDKNISNSYFSGVDDLCIPVSQFQQLNLPIKYVYAVENKMNVLTFPVIDQTIVLFGCGYGIERLQNVDWFNKLDLFYWGDIDVQGFEILSQFRGYFPHVKSVLMDRKTFDLYFENEYGTPSKVKDVLNLTKEERELYDLVRVNNWRLEQEKVPQGYVENTIER